MMTVSAMTPAYHCQVYIGNETTWIPMWRSRLHLRRRGAPAAQPDPAGIATVDAVRHDLADRQLSDVASGSESGRAEPGNAKALHRLVAAPRCHRPRVRL